MGHGVGEYAAAAIAGAFSLEDGLKLIAARSKLMQGLPRNGGMMEIQGKLEKVTEIIAPYASSVSIAAINGPQNIAISGPYDDLLKAAETAGASVCRSSNLKSHMRFIHPSCRPCWGISPGSPKRWSIPPRT